MTFLHPEALWGFLALAIPVIIHLFNFQKTERVVFANTRLLSEVVQKTNKARQIKNWLLLLFRMLALSALILAFAQPKLKSENGLQNLQSLPQVAVFLDNSSSMFISGDASKPFDQAWNFAKNIPSEFSKKGWFQILTNQFESKHLWTSANGYQDQVTEVGNASLNRNFSTVMERSLRQLKNQNLGETKIQYMLSDFQKSAMGNPTTLPIDSSLSYQFVVFEHENLSNVFIDSVWLPRPVQFQEKAQILKIRVAQSGKTYTKPLNLKLLANGNLISGKTITLQDQSVFDVEIPFRIKVGEKLDCQIVIDDLPVSFDNTFYFTLQAPPPSPIYLIDDSKNPFLNAVYKTSIFKIGSGNFRSINYEMLKNADFIVCNGFSNLDEALTQTLESRCREGAAILFLPDQTTTSSSAFPNWIGFRTESISASPGGKVTDAKIKLPAKSDPFFGGTFAEVNSNSSQPFCKPSIQLFGGRPILKYENGDPFLVEQKVGFGSVFVLAGSLLEQNSNLQKHPLFIPMMYKMAFSGSRSADIPLFSRSSSTSALISGDSLSIGSESGLALIQNQIQLRVNPTQAGNRIKIELPAENMKTGFWSMVQNGKTTGTLALNSDKSESEMEFYSAEDLREIFKNKPWIKVSQVAANSSPEHLSSGIESGFSLWKLFLCLSLLFFAGEMALTKFGKSNA